MARIAGIDLPKNKRGVIGLTYVFGIGLSTAKEILADNGISEDTKVMDWNDDEAPHRYLYEYVKVKLYKGDSTT